jgi:hypothetical protein
MFEGITLKDAGRKPESPEAYKTAAIGSEENPKMIYPRLWTDTKETPVDIKRFKAGDKLYFVAEVNVSEISNVDRDGVEEPEATRFELEFLKVGIKPFESKEKPKDDDGFLEDADQVLADTVKPPEDRIF